MMHSSTEVSSQKIQYKNAIASSLVACLGTMAVGTVLGYSSPAIPNLNAHRNPFHVTENETSWIGSIISLGSMFGALTTGFFMDLLGRRTTMLVGTVPFVIGWLIIVASPNAVVMIVGRFITGFFKGLMLSNVGVYISEVAPTVVRGQLGTFQELILNGGVLFTYVLGAYLSWNWLAVACACILTVMQCLLVFSPETPRWLLSKGRNDEAKDTLQWLRGKRMNVSAELTEIEQGLKTSCESISILEFFKPPLRRPFIISQGLAMIQQLSGANVIKAYTVSIFKNVGTKLDANLETVIIGIVGVLGTIIASVAIERVGRRTLYITSTVSMTISMLATGAYFKVKETDPEFALESLYWLPILTLVVYSLGFALACGPVFYVVTCEIFSTRARGRASSLSIVMQGLCGFLITKFFGKLSDILGDSGAFWVCGGICFFGFVFVFTLLPETKGKSLEDIQNYFK